MIKLDEERCKTCLFHIKDKNETNKVFCKMYLTKPDFECKRYLKVTIK